jgi:tetratricopeptide (TPR) repeat protein
MIKSASVLVLTICLFLVGPCSLAPAYGFFAEGPQLTYDQMLSIAETQYEIAKLLIKDGRYDRVLPEMRKILDLNFQGENEQLVAKSSSLIARLLVENKQVTLAHTLLDETLVRMKQRENVASLLKIKAYLYKSEGKLQKAIETLERAVEIERQGTQQ